MLKNMRKQFKRYSWTLWLVILAFLIGFSFTDPFRTKADKGSDLLSVGSRVISANEYNQKLLKTIESYSRTYNRKIDRNFIMQRRIPEEVMQRLIATKIILNEADKLNITVSDDELSESVKNYSQVFYDKDKGPSRYFPFREFGSPTGRFVGRREYIEWLARNEMNVNDFEVEQRENLIMEKFMALVTEPLVIDAETLQEKYKEENDSVNLDFIALKPDRIQETVAVTTAEMQEHYEKNKENYKSEEKRAGLVIAVKSADMSKDVPVSDKEIFTYYRDNKDKFRTPEKIRVSRILLKYDEKNREQVYQEAEALLQQLTPENFAQKATTLSQEPKATEGGDWGYTAWQSFTDQEKTFIESLEAKGISPAIDTLQGSFSIIHVPEKVEESQRPLDEVKADIADNLKSGRLNELVQKKINDIHNKLKDAADLKAKAAELKIEVSETGILKNNDPVTGLDSGGYIARTLFSLEKVGKTSEPVNFIDGMAIVHLTQIVPPVVDSFNNVKEKVKGELETARKVQILVAESREIAQQLNTLKDEAAIKKYLEGKKLEAIEVTYKRGNRLSYLPIKEGLDETIFNLTDNVYSAPIEFDNQAVIVKSKSKTLTKPEDFAKARETFYEQKVMELRNQFFNSYLTQAQARYEFKTLNAQLYEDIKAHIVNRFN